MRTQFFNEDFPIMEIFDDVVLRQLHTSDAVEYFYYMNNENVAEYIASGSLPSSVSHAVDELKYWASLFSSRRSIYWGIAEKSSNKLIGTVGYNNIWHTHSRGELSYDLDFNYWGRGIMFKALEGILEFSEETIGLTRIQATVIETNERSAKMLKKLNFECEGLLQKYEYLRGDFYNSNMYAKILNPSSL